MNQIKEKNNDEKFIHNFYRCFKIDFCRYIEDNF